MKPSRGYFAPTAAARRDGFPWQHNSLAEVAELARIEAAHERAAEMTEHTRCRVRMLRARSIAAGACPADPPPGDAA